MYYSLLPTALVATTSLFTTTNAHSWVDVLRLVTGDGPNAVFTGDPGASRGYYNHSLPGFNDTKMVYFVEEGHGPNPSMCADTQQLGAPQPNGAKSLQAPPGSMIALLYQENGHVTLPQNVPGKQNNSGTVYIYGTAQPKQNETFYEIHKIWNTAGTGGDKRGKLLTTQNFDDGRCYQKNASPIYADRSTRFHIDNATNPEGEDLWCQNNIVLPQEAQTGKPYSLYWVWDWPTMPGTPGQPNGMNQTYTTCIDIDVVAGSSTNSKAAIPAKDAQAPAGIQAAALPSVVQQMGDGKNVYVQTSAIQGGVPPAASGAPQSHQATTSAAAAPSSAASAAATSQKPSAAQTVAASSPGAALSIVPVPTGSVPVTATATPSATSGAATSPAAAPSSSSTPAPAVSVSVQTITVFTDHSAAATTGPAPGTAILSEVAPSGSGGPMVPAATSPARAVANQASSSAATASSPAGPCKPSGAQKRSIIFGHEHKRSVVFGGGDEAVARRGSTDFVEEPLEEAGGLAARAPTRSKRRSPKFAKDYMS